MNNHPRIFDSAFFMAFFILFCAYVFIVSMSPIWDSDIWWHLRVGEWIVQHRSFPKLDMFSAIHPEKPWNTFNWLFEILLYGLYKTVGLFGIRIFFALLILTGFQLWMVYFWKVTQDRKITFFLLIILLFLFADRLRIRPHLINFVFEGLTLLFLFRGGLLRTMQQRILFLVVALFWSNFHNPCAALVAGVVVANSLFQIVRLSRQPLKSHSYQEYIIPAVLSVLAIFCNPYGASLLFSGITNIAPVYQAFGEGEWIPPLYYLLTSSNMFEIVVCLIPLLAAVSAIALVIKKITLRNPETLPNDAFLCASPGPLFFLIISQTAMRFIYLSSASIVWMLNEVGWQTKRIRFIIAVITVCLVSLLFQHQIVEQGGFKTILANISTNVMPNRNPTVATDLIRNAKFSGKIFTPFAWGGYVLWYAHPAGGVSADGRSNTTMEVLQLQNLMAKSLGRSTSNIILVLKELDVDIAILPKDAFPFHHWPTSDWIRVAYDPVAEVFVRVGSTDMKKIQEWLDVKSNDPLLIQQSATHYFGEQYYRSMKSELEKLPTSTDGESIHNRIDIEEMASHTEIATRLLVEHLDRVPNCIRAATELAEILHDDERYDAAWKLLSPLQGFQSLPTPTLDLMNHLRKQHILKDES